MSCIKEQYRRFRQWQVTPRQYEAMGSEMHCCCNCSQEYMGGFCPRCGQKANTGRISWTTVRNGLMDVFGLGDRSLPNSIWQLLWRPGYFISEYINGKLQVSFPPVKMLLLVAVLVYFFGKLIFPEYWYDFLDEGSSSRITSTGLLYYLEYALVWLSDHMEWGLLLLFSLMVLPTWYVFRYSPCNPRHTVPQGFFIQVFITVQSFLWMFILSFCLKPFTHSVDTWLLLFGFVMPVLYLLDYKQLFGYGWWGTLWRLLCVVLIVSNCIILPIAFFSMPEKLMNHRFLFRIVVFIVFSVSCLGLLLAILNVVNRKLWREHGLWRSMFWPLLFFMVSVALMLVLVWPKLGS